MVSPWWLGTCADHLYETCPARMRGIAELRWAGWDHPGQGAIGPDWDGVCGWCRRVWHARANRGVAE